MFRVLAVTVYSRLSMTFICADMLSAGEVTRLIGVLIVGARTLARPIIFRSSSLSCPAAARGQLYRSCARRRLVLVVILHMLRAGIAGV